MLCEQVDAFAADNVVRDFTFYVDGTMSNVRVKVSDSSGSLSAVSFTSPKGSAFAGYTVTLNLPSLKVYTMGTLQPGLWRASMTNSGRPFSVAVLADSPISFTYQIAVLDEDPHPGYFPITGNPVVGKGLEIHTRARLLRHRLAKLKTDVSMLHRLPVQYHVRQR